VIFNAAKVSTRHADTGAKPQLVYPGDAVERKLVAIAKLRLRNQRDCEELKQGLGLGHC